MRKTFFLLGIFLLCLLVYGCPPKAVPLKTDRFEALFTDGRKYEAQQEWQKAQTAYQAAITAASDDRQIEAVRKRLAGVEKQLRLETLYEKFVDYQKRKAWAQMCETLSEACPIAPDNRYVLKMMAALAVKHLIRPGDLISELCQYYYGRTEGYELVKCVNAFNKINNPKNIELGQMIIFPVIALPDKPLFIPNPEPQPKPAPKLIPKPIPQPTQSPATMGQEQAVPRQCLEKGIGFFNDRQFQEAIDQFETCVSQYPEDKTICEWLSRAYFQLGLHLFLHKRYPAALSAFNASYKNYVHNPECKAYINKTQKMILKMKRDTEPILRY